MNLILWILISFLPGAFGSFFKPGDWYATLPKPPWTPPKIAFPVVWTSLYVLIGVSAHLAFKGGLDGKRTALGLFIAHLILNALWSWIFFGRHWIGSALMELLMLWAIAVAMTIAFSALSKISGALLVPYVLWLTVALSLNGFIWWKTK